MTDLYSRMERLSGPVEPVPAAAVEGDLVRGRRAVRSRRFAQGGAGAVVGIAAVAAAFALTATVPGDSAGQRPPVIAQTGSTGGIQLVAYTGEQPKGFTIDTVPAGFSIKRQNEYELVLAPDRATVPAPESSVPVIENSNGYDDAIAVYLDDLDDMWGDQVTVDGKPAWTRMITTPDGAKAGGQIFIAQADGVYLIVQVSETVGLNKDQMLQIAGGVHVAPDLLATYTK
jgi:hypothetical protein